MKFLNFVFGWLCGCVNSGFGSLVENLITKAYQNEKT